MSTVSDRTLDNVDLSRQVRRDFEADFLLAYGGLCPGLHDDLLIVKTVAQLFIRSTAHYEKVSMSGDNYKSQIRDLIIRFADPDFLLTLSP
jgi:hypothetical protein